MSGIKTPSVVAIFLRPVDSIQLSIALLLYRDYRRSYRNIQRKNILPHLQYLPCSRELQYMSLQDLNLSSLENFY